MERSRLDVREAVTGIRIACSVNASHDKRSEPNGPDLSLGLGESISSRGVRAPGFHETASFALPIRPWGHSAAPERQPQGTRNALSGVSRIAREFARGHPAAGRTRSLATIFPAPVRPAPGGDFATRSPRCGGAGFVTPLREWLDGASGCALHTAFAASGLSPLRHCGSALAPCAYRGLRASCFALPWRAAIGNSAVRIWRKEALQFLPQGR